MTDFFKLSGSGNDFIALVEPAEIPASEQIHTWCRRGVSLGADGLFVLRRRGAGDPGGSGPREAEVAMDYWNADGMPAELCLNGTRCAAQLAYHLGWAEGALTVHTGSGSFPARRLDASRIALEIKPPGSRPAQLTVEGHEGFLVDAGVPHFVLFWPEDLADAPVVPLGRQLRHAEALAPSGANIDFVRFPSLRRMEIRTYERGVEDETLSCGTGVLAAATTGILAGQAIFPLTAVTRGGFELTMQALSTTSLSLSGDARVVAEGRLL